ncbi:MAG: hypothetical protein Q8J63_01025 [Candidatus Aquicultor sp.]|nr:hypothetical protein [Candidatus Aquicultor sp.]
MGMIPTHEELESMSEQDLILRYDAEARNTVVGTQFFRDELIRRRQNRQTYEMLAFTRQVRNMTIAITVFTVISAILVAVTILK